MLSHDDHLAVNRIILGDCLEVLRTLPDASVDAIVTDPPAGISFMGKGWDSDKGGRNAWVAWLAEVMAECLRVVRPGGHALVWALPRTSHWTATALEDAGFEIRDCVTHLFGSGFPKSRNLDGAHEGWGTALKPAAEFWWLCRKPLSEPTVAANVLRWGVGALNIGASRVEGEAWSRSTPYKDDIRGGHLHSGKPVATYEVGPQSGNPAGRWPANLVLSHTMWCREIGAARVKAHGSVSGQEPSSVTNGIYGEFADRVPFTAHGDGDGYETVTRWECDASCPVAELDRQSGTTSARFRVERNSGRADESYYRIKPTPGTIKDFGDTGGASRYFPTFHYTPKASRSERNHGCATLSITPHASAPDYRPHDDPEANTLVTRLHGSVARPGNHHPTVKPLALMRWLIGLVTPPDGIVLDPFAGSGSTLVAAQMGGWRFLGIEREAEYVAIAEARLAASHSARPEAASPDQPAVTLAPTPPAPPPTQPRRAHPHDARRLTLPAGMTRLSLFPTDDDAEAEIAQ